MQNYIENTRSISNKMKYVRLMENDAVIIFPTNVEHSTFADLKIKSAGFCFINGEKKTIECFGKSYSLGISSLEELDSLAATRQYFHKQITLY